MSLLPNQILPYHGWESKQLRQHNASYQGCDGVGGHTKEVVLHELVGEPQLLTPAQREELHQFFGAG